MCDDVFGFVELPKMHRILATGIDHGMTNATAGIMLGLGIDPRDQRYKLYALDEWAPPKATPAEHSEMYRAWIKTTGHEPEWHFVDPAAEVLRYQLYRDGLPRVANASNSHAGIQTIASLFKAGRLLISDRCEHLIAEIPNYVWDKKASEKGEDKVIKVDDHFCDSLRYSCVSAQHLWESYELLDKR